MKVIVMFLTIGTLWAPSAFSQETNEVDSQMVEEAMESIDVQGNRHKSFYRREFRHAQDNFFELMNDLSDRDEYDVVCTRVPLHSFTRITVRKCQPKFLSLLLGELTQRNFELMSPSARLGDNPLFDVTLKQEILREFKRMRQDQLEYLVELIQANPQLLKAYQQLVNAKTRYEKAKGI